MSEVVVSSCPDKGLQHEVKTSHHTFISDAGAHVGGTESGPDPHELLLGALGACTSMTLQLFAKKRGWPLEQVSVALTEETVEDPATPGKKMSKISRKIEVKGELTAEQLDSLKQIANKCPIHKLLVESKEISTDLASLN